MRLYGEVPPSLLPFVLTMALTTAAGLGAAVTARQRVEVNWPKVVLGRFGLGSRAPDAQSPWRREGTGRQERSDACEVLMEQEPISPCSARTCGPDVAAAAGKWGAGTLTGMPKQKRPFEVEIEAKLAVFAFDEVSARKKVERALASGRNLDTDVQATGAVWTYARTGRSGHQHA